MTDRAGHSIIDEASAVSPEAFDAMSVEPTGCNDHFEAPDPLTSLQRMTKVLTDKRQMIEEALAYSEGTHNFDDIVAGVLTNEFILLDFDESVIVAQVLNYPRKRQLHMFLGGGKMNDFIAMLPRLNDLASRLGCDSLSMTGRPGWKPVVLAHGWQVSPVMHATRVVTPHNDVPPVPSISENNDGESRQSDE